MEPKIGVSKAVCTSSYRMMKRCMLRILEGDWRTSIKRSESKFIENGCIRCGFRLAGYDFVFMTGIVDVG